MNLGLEFDLWMMDKENTIYNYVKTTVVLREWKILCAEKAETEMALSKK